MIDTTESLPDRDCTPEELRRLADSQGLPPSDPAIVYLRHNKLHACAEAWEEDNEVEMRTATLLRETEARLEAAERHHIERKYIDARPDDAYPLRILRAYRADCDMRWSLSTTNGGQEATPLMEALNAMQDQRAAILDKAMAALALKETPPDVPARLS